MSTAEREQEYVAGSIVGIIQKGPDKWQVEVDTGQQNPRRLWTKSKDTVDALSAKIGEHTGFVCDVSHWTNNEGKQIRSLWLSEVSDEAPENVPNAIRPSAAPSNGGKASTDGMTKEEWARKDSAIHKMACIKTAAAALTHTIPSDPSKDDLAAFMERVVLLSQAWHRSVLAERDDPSGDTIPF